ncbi:MAG: S-layer family protein, partial [Propionivibrio sp.]
MHGFPTTLTPTAHLALTNRGLIDGTDTFISSSTLANLGTGRIYGDHVAIATTTLTNAPETVAGVTSAPVIAARNRLDLGAATIANAEHALLFSAGALAIGDTLSADHRASGQAGVVSNASATIEALGDLTLSAHQINNTNEHFSTTVVAMGSESITEYQGNGAATRYLAGSPGVNTYYDESEHLHTPEGNYSTWLAYRYTRTTTETQVTASDPGRILAGGSISLAADNLHNDNSQIIAGGTLAGTVGTLNNDETAGERTFTDVGTVTTYWRHHRDGKDNTHSSSIAYAPPDTIQTISLGVTAYAGATAPAGSGTHLSALTLAPVAATAAGSGAAVASLGAGQTRAALIQVPTLSGQLVVTVAPRVPDTRLPESSLFRPTPDHRAPYLIETDPRFTRYQTWLASDYLLDQLGLDPAGDQKRLGDGFYEQRLLREQIGELTGRRFLDGYASDEAQYRALMDAGVSVAREWHLVPGIALSAAQMAQLTTDIVWLVEQTVTLADGTTQKALVPQVYARIQPGDLATGGSLIAANNIDLQLAGDLTNAGTIAGRELVVLSAENIGNLGGRISGRQVGLTARSDLNNRGGRIEATDTLIAAAGHDLTVASSTRSQANANGSRTNIDRVAGLYVTGSGEGSGGTLIASAGNDLTLLAAVVNSGPGTTTGSTRLEAGHDLSLGTVEEAASNHLVWDRKNHRDDASRTTVGSTIQTTGDLTLTAGHDLTATAASVTSEQGALTALAGNDLTITAGQARVQVDEAHQHKEKG